MSSGLVAGEDVIQEVLSCVLIMFPVVGANVSVWLLMLWCQLHKPCRTQGSIKLMNMLTSTNVEFLQNFLNNYGSFLFIYYNQHYAHDWSG